jgi:hypothetical protein
VRRITLLLCAHLALSACGESAAYEPGSIPTSLTFSVVRVQDSELDGAASQLEVWDRVDVGRPTPDYFDGRAAVWRCRTLFGDLVDEPGAKLEFAREGTVLSKEDPWRVSGGLEFCLVVNRRGEAMVQWLDVEDPRDIEGGWDAAEMRLRVDESRFAAHRQLGVLRVQILRDDEVVDTVTEDDFQAWSWRLYDENGEQRNAWSLRALAAEQGGRIVSIRGRDGSSASIRADWWADAERTPALRLEDGVLTFCWEGLKAADAHISELPMVTAVQLVRDD